jgi:hypothetical protein
MVSTYNIAGTKHAFVLDGTRFISYDHPDASATFFGGVRKMNRKRGLVSRGSSLSR